MDVINCSFEDFWEIGWRNVFIIVKVCYFIYFLVIWYFDVFYKS